MGRYIYNPTAFQSPDATLGGNAVSSPSNTGHASTGVSAIGDEFGFPDKKSCRWSGFSSGIPGGGNTLSRKLKVTHSSGGSLVGGTASNFFQLSYSLNGGSNWTNAVTRSNFTASQNNTFSVDLPIGQDLTQVQVRDFVEASAFNIGDSASATATISDIQIEVITVNQVIAMM